MTKQEAIDNHRQMWRWIAEKTRERRKVVHKIDYFNEAAQTIDIPKGRCWCCEYTLGIRGFCGACPIKWTGYYCFIGGSEYNMWLASTDNDDWREAAHWAAVIAELPERL